MTSRQLAWVAHIPWTVPLLAFVSKVLGEGGSWKALQKTGAEAVHARIGSGSGQRDLFHYLVSLRKFHLLIVCDITGFLAFRWTATILKQSSHLWLK